MSGKLASTETRIKVFAGPRLEVPFGCSSCTAKPKAACPKGEGIRFLTIPPVEGERIPHRLKRSTMG